MIRTHQKDRHGLGPKALVATVLSGLLLSSAAVTGDAGQSNAPTASWEAPGAAIRLPWHSGPAWDLYDVSGPSGGIGTALMAGFISWAEPDLGVNYLATRFPVGTRVRLCVVRCIVRTTTDFGPSDKISPSRIADLAVLDWEQVTGLPRSVGVAFGMVEALKDITLPPTDSE